MVFIEEKTSLIMVLSGSQKRLSEGSLSAGLWRGHNLSHLNRIYYMFVCSLLVKIYNIFVKTLTDIDRWDDGAMWSKLIFQIVSWLKYVFITTKLNVRINNSIKLLCKLSRTWPRNRCSDIGLAFCWTSSPYAFCCWMIIIAITWTSTHLMKS